MDHQINDRPAELDDRDLDLVSGGWGETLINGSGNGNTSQNGLINVSALNGNLDGLNLLSSLSV
jgi:hypothetical protein